MILFDLRVILCAVNGPIDDLGLPRGKFGIDGIVNPLGSTARRDKVGFFHAGHVARYFGLLTI